MTNREKFKETFGFRPNPDAECVAPTSICDIQNDICNDCPFENWWEKEYIPCFKMLEELQ